MNIIKMAIVVSIVFVLKKIRRMTLYMAKCTAMLVVTDDVWADINQMQWESAKTKLAFAQQVWGDDPDIIYALMMIRELQEEVDREYMASVAGNAGSSVA